MGWRTCVTCKGPGTLLRKGRMITCPACKGKGGKDIKTI